MGERVGCKWIEYKCVLGANWPDNAMLHSPRQAVSLISDKKKKISDKKKKIKRPEDKFSNKTVNQNSKSKQ